MHRDIKASGIDALKDSWSSDTAFFTSSGELKDREEGLLILLQWALAYSDFAHMSSLPLDQQPVPMQRSKLDAADCMTAIENAVKASIPLLRAALQIDPIPPRPGSVRRVWNVSP